MDTDPTVFPDPSRQMADAVSSIARNLESLTITQQTMGNVLARLTSVLRFSYACLALVSVLGLCGISFLIWHGIDMHKQTRVIVQTNQALLLEVLKRHP